MEELSCGFNFLLILSSIRTQLLMLISRKDDYKPVFILRSVSAVEIHIFNHPTRPAKCEVLLQITSLYTVIQNYEYK